MVAVRAARTELRASGPIDKQGLYVTVGAHLRCCECRSTDLFAIRPGTEQSGLRNTENLDVTAQRVTVRGIATRAWCFACSGWSERP